MKSPGIVELVSKLADVDVAAGDFECCTRVLHDLTRLIAWAEAGKIDAAQRLAALAVNSPGILPEHVVATATQVSLGQATQPFKRATAIEAMPSFGDALAAGTVSARHVDVIANAVTKLDPIEQQRFGEREQFLAGVAQRTTAGEFARTVRTEMLRCQRGDGADLLQRQRKAAYLKTWVDQISGMWCLHGELDPETGARLSGRLARTIEKLFHDKAPDTAPADSIDKQHHLRALAIAAIIDGTGATGGGIDISILIDATTLISGKHPGTIIDFGLPIDLSIESIRRMACTAAITPIIVGADGVKLHVGLTTRLATREQRRALRAMYHGCAIPGCSVSWDHVVIHHLTYFRYQGPTNIDNLLPLCNKHHHYAHEGGWQLTLTTNRTLTITHPDGTTKCHSPPKALAA
jgi:Domain of unknown function (DUF222)